MAIPVSYAFSGASRLGPRASAPVLLVAIALCGCSFDLGSWSSAPEKETAPKAAPAEAEGGDAQAATRRGQALVRSGKTEEARAEFDQAIALDPYNAQALYSRGLLRQSEQQHQLAIDDFTAANGLTPQRAEPLLARAVSYLALDKIKEAAADLDEAAQADPQNAEILTGGLPMNVSATRPRPRAHIAAPSTFAPGMKRRETALPASAASPARTTMRSRAIPSELDIGSRKKTRQNQPEPVFRSNRGFELVSELFRQYRVKYRFRR